MSRAPLSYIARPAVGSDLRLRSPVVDLASRGVDPMAIVETRAERIEAQARYYNRDIHRGAFAVPNDLRRRD